MTDGVVPTTRRSVQLRPTVIVALGAVSLVTMPLTAVWFLGLAMVLLAATVAFAAVARQPRRSRHAVGTGASVALGLLVGPAVYLALAVAVAVV